MNIKYAAIFALAVGLVAGSLFIAQAQSEVKPPPPDTRIDKLLEQNEKILKNQDEILKRTRRYQGRRPAGAPSLQLT